MARVNPSKRQIKEGDLLTTNFSSLTRRANYYYRIVGSNVNKSDFSAGSITGTIRATSNGTAKLTHRLKADKLTEGTESFRIQVFSDQKMRQRVVQSEIVTVFDTSTKPISATLKVSPSKRQIKEGDLLTTNFSGLKRGTKFYYRIIGSNVNKSDFSAGSITGTITATKNGTAKLSHRLKADKLTEGNESLRVQVFSDKNMKNLVVQSELVSVIDSSKRVSSSKDPVTGMTVAMNGLGTLQSDKKYGLGSSLVNFFPKTSGAPYVKYAELEFGASNYIVLTTELSNGGRMRSVIEGSFKYGNKEVTSARIKRMATISSNSSYGYGDIVLFNNEISIANPQSAYSWQASLSQAKGTTIASFDEDKGKVINGSLNAFTSFGGGKFFYNGWTSATNLFNSDLI